MATRSGWNTTTERLLFDAMVSYTSKMIEDEVTASSDEYSSDASTTDNLMSFNSSLSSLSSLSSMSSDDDSLSFSSNDSICEMIDHCNEYGKLIFVNNNNIIYRHKDLIIDDVAEEISDNNIVLEFCFRKNHLYIIANALWPLANTFLVGECNKIMIGKKQDYCFVCIA